MRQQEKQGAVASVSCLMPLSKAAAAEGHNISREEDGHCDGTGTERCGTRCGGAAAATTAAPSREGAGHRQGVTQGRAKEKGASATTAQGHSGDGQLGS